MDGLAATIHWVVNRLTLAFLPVGLIALALGGAEPLAAALVVFWMGHAIAFIIGAFDV